MALDNLGKTLAGMFVTAKAQRSGYEDQWLRDLRQYRGLYDPEVLANIDPKRSKAFIRETRTKVRTIDARIMDLLFPANGEKNWDIKPTPKPEFPPYVEEKLLAAVQEALAANGMNREPLPEELELARLKHAEKISEAMADEIEDQLAEVKYRAIIRDVMHSGHLFGTGWLKGPLVEERTQQRWKQVEVTVTVTEQVTLTDQATGQQMLGTREVPKKGLKWTLTSVPVLKPYVEFRRIWDIYPDMSATELENCKYLFERHVMPKHKVQELARRQDFNKEYIDQYLKDNPEGKIDAANFESTLFNLEEKQETSPRARANLYEVLEFWGYVKGEDLMGPPVDVTVPVVNEAGEQVDEEIRQEQQGEYDPETEYFCNVWVLGDQVIKVTVQPIDGVLYPYYPYYFDKDETSIFGEGVASIMRDPQRLVNASVRAMVDNAAHCAGPQYEVNVDLLNDGEDPSDVGAFKVWLRTGREADVAGKEAVRVKQIASYTPEFMNMRNRFSQDGDEVTIIPRYLQGDSRVSGAGRTARGLSMLMGQANVGLSDLVKMFDDNVTKPFIKALYHWNMQFNDKEEIKGDLEAIATGSTALLAKEIRAQQVIEFLQITMNQYDLPSVKRDDLLGVLADSTDIGRDKAIRTPEERKMWLAEQQEMMQQQQPQQNSQVEQVIGELSQGLQELGQRLQANEQILQAIMEGLRLPMRQPMRQPQQITEGAV
jgi:hypothetical protein